MDGFGTRRPKLFASLGHLLQRKKFAAGLQLGISPVAGGGFMGWAKLVGYLGWVYTGQCMIDTPVLLFFSYYLFMIFTFTDLLKYFTTKYSSYTLFFLLLDLS